MGNVNVPAEEGQVEPLNGYIRIQDLQPEDGVINGLVTDQRQSATLKFGDRVYFRKEKHVLMRINGTEVSFVHEGDIIFRVGE